LNRPWNFAVDKIENDYDIIVPPGIILTEPFTLEARWVVKQFNVSFIANGGVPNPPPQTIDSGDRVRRPPLMSRPGYAFKGWFKEAALLNEWDFLSDIVNSTSGHITLYAKWELAPITVRFHMGSPPDHHTDPLYDTPGSQNLLNTERVIEPFIKQIKPPDYPAPVTNWSFYGWYYYDYNTGPPATSSDINGDWVNTFRSHLRPWNFNDILSAAPSEAFESDGDLHLYAVYVEPVPDMVWVPRGSFTMGQLGVSGSPAILHAYPTRDVTVDGFYISRIPITTEDYAAIMSGEPNPNPSHFVAAFPDIYPVHKVSWFDAIQYCINRTDAEGLGALQFYAPLSNIVRQGSAASTAWAPHSIESADVSITNWNRIGYRLPTEAEWEFAARGGYNPPLDYIFAGGDGSNVDNAAWYNLNSSGKVHGVGQKLPNNLGIYDMSGNVSEWCWDVRVSYSTIANPVTNPGRIPSGGGPVTIGSGSELIRRGGAWSNVANNVRTMVRNSFPPGNSTYVMGFRVVRGPSEFW
jgi:uncharacterized repeat protein (TIGR02543 family)